MEKFPHGTESNKDYSCQKIQNDPSHVIFRGQKVIRGWPEKLRDAQKITYLTFADGTKYPRTKWGDHPYKWKRVGAKRWPCYHCLADPDEYHEIGCDYENCPRCGQQLVSCECRFKEAPFKEVDDEE